MSSSRSSSESGGTTSAAGSSTSTPTPELFSRQKRGRPAGIAKHPVHDFFNYSADEEVSRCVVNGCRRNEVPKNHAGNLMAHMKSHHHKIYMNIKESYACSSSSANKKAKFCSKTLNGVKMSAEALQLHCLRLVTENGLAFKVLDYPAMQDIIQPMVDAMPISERPTISSRTVPDQIDNFAEHVRQTIISEVEGKMVSVKVDGCTKNHRYFVGINIQFELNGESVVRTLAVEELLQAPTAHNLRVLVTMVLKKFKIAPKQIVAFTTDSGANYVLAGKLLTEVQGVADADEDLEEEGDEDDGDWLNVSLELLQDDFSMQSVRCAAHTLQLAIHDALKKEADAKDVIAAVKKLVRFLLHETQVRQLKGAKMALPKLDVCTRWGSTYDMLQSVLRLRNFITSSFKWPTISDRIDNDLTDDDWEKVEQLLEDLKPARKATAQLQRENITLGEFYAIWSGMVMVLEKRREDSSLVRGLLKAMEDRSKSVAYKDKKRGERLAPLFHYPSFNGAVFLDPRFMSLLSSEQASEAKLYLVDLWERMQAVRGPDALQPDPESDSSEEAPLSDDEDEGSALFGRLLAQKNKERLAATGAAATAAGSVTGTGSRATKRAALLALLDEYDRNTIPLDASENVFLYWQKKKLASPELYELAMVVLTIPATQVSVERLFSALRFILRPQRFGLGAAHIDGVAFLNANADVVQNVVKQLLQKRKASVSEEENPL